MNRITRIAFLLIFSIFFLIGCGGKDTAVTESAELAAEKPTATIRPTDTITPSPTFTPTATNTATSTNTPNPTSTFTPTPTDTPEPTDTATPTNTPTTVPTPVPTLPPPPPTSAPTEPPPPPAYATWKNIPIMPGAHDAFEDSNGSYWYLVDTSGSSVRQFYTQTIGWEVFLVTGDDSFGSLWIGNGDCQTSVLYEYRDGSTGVMILNGCP